MVGSIVLTALNAKYIHASPAPWCLAAGVQAYAPQFYDRVRVIDATVNQPRDEVLAQIVGAEPIVVGMTCYLWNICSTLELCAELKKALPHVIIALGGPEVSYCARDVLERNTQVDYILAGEGEESFSAFLTAILRGSELEHIDGLCGRRKDGTIYVRDACVLQGEVPSPIEAGYAEAARGRITYFETSRGCLYSCAFCLSGRCGAPRYFEMDYVLKNLLHLANSGTHIIKFVDRTFNANPIHANAILQFILTQYGKKIPEGVCFHFEIAGDILREETFSLLEQMPAGAVQLEIGMQSFDEQTLEAVQRKTDIRILQANITRLVAMKNMHIHIDLIAGLPYEGMEKFAASFNTGYALGAQMLQLGFLKLLHGSDMRGAPEQYPCKFDEKPPYEVRTTPWLSEQDFETLHEAEDAVERVYNSGRFHLTAEYVLGVSEKTPFDFYKGVGAAVAKAGVNQRISLDEFTKVLQEHCVTLNGVGADLLRDMLVRDRLSTNSTGRLPPCLHRQDTRLGKEVKRLNANQDTAAQKGIRRGVALLYAAKAVCWADYSPAAQHPVTGRWELHEMELNQ